MAHNSQRSEDVKTPLARLAFVQGLFELQTTKSGKKQWNVTLLFPKATDLKALHEAAFEAAEKAWPGKAKQFIQDGLIKSPFLDGDGKQGLSKKTGERHAGYAGHTFVRLISGEEWRPKLLNQKVLPITGKDQLKSGDYAYAVVNAFTWENDEQGKGLSFGVSMIQKARDGDPLGNVGGGGDPDKFFEKIEDEGDAPESTKSGAGAGGLFG